MDDRAAGGVEAQQLVVVDAAAQLDVRPGQAFEPRALGAFAHDNQAPRRPGALNARTASSTRL